MTNVYILAADHFRAVGLADVGHTGRTLAKDQMTDKVGNTGHSPGTRRSVDRQRAAGTTISAVEMVILGHTLSLLASDRYPICGIIQGDAVFNLSAILKPDWLNFWKPNWLYAATFRRSHCRTPRTVPRTPSRVPRRNHSRVHNCKTGILISRLPSSVAGTWSSFFFAVGPTEIRTSRHPLAAPVSSPGTRARGPLSGPECPAPGRSLHERAPAPSRPASSHRPPVS